MGIHHYIVDGRVLFRRSHVFPVRSIFLFNFLPLLHYLFGHRIDGGEILKLFLLHIWIPDSPDHRRGSHFLNSWKTFGSDVGLVREQVDKRVNGPAPFDKWGHSIIMKISDTRLRQYNYGFGDNPNTYILFRGKAEGTNIVPYFCWWLVLFGFCPELPRATCTVLCGHAQACWDLCVPRHCPLTLAKG